MPDLHDWITQRVNETEHGARAATELQALDWSCPSTGVVDLGSDLLATGDRDVAYHVVRHDPAAVLRRCTADRKILEHHAPIGGGWPGHYACAGCGYDGGYCPEPYTEHVNDCPTLLALAEGYGLTEDQRAALDRPEMEQPPRKPGFGGMPDVLVEQMVRVSLATVPPGLRGPNWKP
jgi:hypothetical protein